MATTSYAPLLAYSSNPEQNDIYSSQFEAGTAGSNNAPSWLAGNNSSSDTNYVQTGLQLTSDTASQDSSYLNNLGMGATALQMAGGIGTDNSMSGGGLGGWGAAAGGVGTAMNIYNGATTNTTGSVLSGAAQGAAYGTMIMPGIGTAVGAVIGGVLGFFGSSSKKNAAKKAYQQQLEMSIAPQKQAQANYLQNQGLLQKAISNYGSAYTAGGPTYTNPLLKNSSNSPFTFGQPKGTPSLPDFSKGPNDVATGQTQDTTKGIAPLWQGQTAGNALEGQTESNTPLTYNRQVAQQQPVQQPQMPSWTGDQATDQANLQKYQQQYSAYINYTNQQRAGAAVGNYAQYYGG